ncbi:Ku protein [Bacillaceae bacterium]
MHTMWKGSISFGLVNIPVRMFAATEEKDIRFRYLHRECHTPIRYAKMCPACEREVSLDEIVKGYEYEPGRFVILEEEDFRKITPETRKTIEIIDFVDLREIDPVYFDRSYYLSPAETGDKAYALLREAMEQTGKIAIAKITLRAKQNLAVVRLYHGCILLETIFYPDEVRSVELVPDLPRNVELTEKEVQMAVQLIENLAAPFEPEKYTDAYRSELRNLLQKKIEGKEIAQAPEVKRTNVVDLMEALQASLEATQREKDTAKKKRTSRKKQAAQAR